MKKFLFLIVFCIPALLFSQEYPLGVNDTVEGVLNVGEVVEVNVVNNDTDPQGDYIRIIEVFGANNYVNSFTDSTITFTVPMKPGGEVVQESFFYQIEDEFGNSQPGLSQAMVVFYINNESFEFLDINNISAQFNAFGNHFWDFDSGFSHYRFPKDSLTNTLFTLSLWLGGMDENGQLRIAGERYRQVGSDYQTGPLSFNADSAWIPPEVVADYFYIWKLDKAAVEYHVLHWNDPGYEPIENILTWPAHGDPELNQAEYLAPFIDVDFDGIYDPYNGDYPLIRGDQTLFFIFNDQKLHTETDGQPIGAEIHGFAYAFDAPENPALNNTTFLSYKIFNRGQHSLSDTYAGLFSDLDLGYAWDDYIGCDVERGAYYCYNGEEIDGNGDPGSYGAAVPAQGVVVLGGPYMDSDGLDNPSGGCDESINGVGFGDGEVDNERFGMNNFIYFNNGGSPYFTDPSYDFQYYSYLQSTWLDSTHMLYGGNGHILSGAYGPECRFMFPGLSDPCNWGTGGLAPNGPEDWTELTAGNDPSDRRGLCSMGPFTIEPGGFHKIDIALVTGLGDDYLASVDVLMQHIDSVKTYYFADPDEFGFAWLGQDEHHFIDNTSLEIYPNPAHDIVSFSLQPASKDAFYEVFSLMGYAVKKGLLRDTENQQINLDKLHNGMYLLRIVDGDHMYSARIIKN